MAGKHGNAFSVEVPTDEVKTDDAVVESVKPTSVKRIKAIPFSGGTTVIVRAVDFANAGVEHPDVTWDYRIDNFTVAVGDGISAEAASVLVSKFPGSFEFV